MNTTNVLNALPYDSPFLFVDKLDTIDENGVRGSFRFDEELDFYKGHFKDTPVTPGVILTECCAQIGLVCLGIFLLHQEGQSIKKTKIAFSESQMEFLLPVYPNETVTVFSEKIYFRFNKLKCKVKMLNADQKIACKGVLSGMLIPTSHEK